MLRDGSIRYGTTATAAGAALLGALILAGQLAGAGAGTVGDVVQTAPLAALYALAGALVLAGAPGHPVGRLMLAAGASAGAAAAGLSWSSWAPAGWLGQWAWWPPFGLGHPGAAGVSGRPAAVAALASGGRGGRRRDGRRRRGAGGRRAGPPPDAAHIRHRVHPARPAAIRIGFGFGVLGLAGLVAAVTRCGHDGAGPTPSPGASSPACCRPQSCCRSRLRLELASLSGAWLLSALALPVGMTVAVLRYRLYGLDRSSTAASSGC